MTHHHETQKEISDESIDPSIAGHCDRCREDVSFIAYVLGAAILVGSILVSASIFYNFRMVSKQMTDLVKSTAVQQPAAPIAAAAQAPTTPVNIVLKPNAPFLGKADAKVTVVEYADYQCPFCERFFTQVMPEIKTKYIDTGKIKFVYQDFAFLGADSNTAAEASRCAQDQNKFWEYHDYLFNHQGRENGNWATASRQKEFAKAIGLNTAQFNQCLDSGKHKQEVLDDTAAAKAYGVTGTPTVFVNGTSIVGAQPTAAFVAAIDAALKK